MVFVHHKIAGRAGVLVLGVLGQGPHIPSSGLVNHRVGSGDDKPFGNVRAGLGNFFGISKDPHGLPPVHGGTINFRLHLKNCRFRLIGWVHHVPAHVIKGLPGFFRGLKISSGPLVVGPLKPPGPVLLMDPTIGAAQVKHLPRLELDGLAMLHPPGLDTLPKPPDNPICPGGIKDIGEIFRPLALEVIQMPLAGLDLIGAAQVMEPSPGHLLGIDADRMV